MRHVRKLPLGARGRVRFSCWASERLGPTARIQLVLQYGLWSVNGKLSVSMKKAKIMLRMKVKATSLC